MAGLRCERFLANKTLWAALVLASAGCSFDAGGLGLTGETGSQNTGTSSSGSLSSTGGESTPTSSGATTAGPAGEASATGETGSTGPVDPVTSTTATTTTTGEPSTGTTVEPMTTSTGDTTTTGDDTTMSCVEKTYYKDDDTDGFGDTDQTTTACAAPPGYVEKPGDCDDKQKEVNPSKEETCNDVDDDCDEHVDEYDPPVNTDCDDCKMALYNVNNRVYYFCDKPKKWVDAQTTCEKYEGFLATDLDGPHHEWLLDQIPNGSDAWYIGGTSPNKDEMFVWIDGTPVPNPDDRWGVGRPGGGGATNRLAIVARNNLDFWLTYNGKWFDRGEGDAEPFVCESEFFP